jgi:hypothetical protein
VIASHYAEPVERVVVHATSLRDAPSTEGDQIAEIEAGTPFLTLDDSLGWAWGYAGADGRVGYVESGALGRSAAH